MPVIILSFIFADGPTGVLAILLHHIKQKALANPEDMLKLA
jgi:hypothetical protein